MVRGRGTGVSFAALCASIRHGTVRQTTLEQVRDAGRVLIPSGRSGSPPYHCDLAGLTVAGLDAILSPEEGNQLRCFSAGEA